MTDYDKKLSEAITVHTATGEVFPLDELTRGYIRALQETYGPGEEGWQLRQLGLKGWRQAAAERGP